jgi:hypothetical protein
MGKLQVTSPLHVVWEQPPAQGLSRNREHFFNTDMLQLPTAPPFNYRGCRHAKEEMQKRRSKRTPNNMTGRMFSSKFTTPTLSFAAALRGNSEQKKRPHLHQDSVAGLINHETSKNEQQQERGQPVRDPNVNSFPSDNIQRTSNAVQQIMTKFENAELEQSRVMAITKLVLYLMNQNGHQNS